MSEQLNWKCPIDDEPPENKELLVKDPQGGHHLAGYRPSYGIFTCQEKSDNMLYWKYIILD